ncbi:hypothetical protein STEG23_037489 [Scotinomys teguina]
MVPWTEVLMTRKLAQLHHCQSIRPVLSYTTVRASDLSHSYTAVRASDLSHSYTAVRASDLCSATPLSEHQTCAQLHRCQSIRPVLSYTAVRASDLSHSYTAVRASDLCSATPLSEHQT